jgi:inhibitor of cysteine peptidase
MEFDLAKRAGWPLVIVVMLVSLAVLGCSAKENRSQTAAPTTAATQPPTIEASGADDGKDITVSVGDTLKLTLTANHSTPFWWAADTQIGDTTILQQTDHQYTASATTTGGPGSEIWTFRALKAGTTTITNHENSVATPGGPSLNTFTAKVTVK